MRFHNVAENILGRKSNIGILRVLAGKGMDLTGRQIAELSGLNHMSCLLSLNVLVNEGIVTLRSAGRANLYRLRENNLFVRECVIPLFRLERNLIDRIFDEVIDAANDVENGLGGKMLSLVLFGSIARGDEKPDSDIDICVVVRNKATKLRMRIISEQIEDRVTGTFGNGLSLYPVDIHEFRERFAKRDPLIMEILEGMYARGERVERFLRDVDHYAHVRARGDALRLLRQQVRVSDRANARVRRHVRKGSLKR